MTHKQIARLADLLEAGSFISDSDRKKWVRALRTHAETLESSARPEARITLEAGKRYVTRNGRVAVVLRVLVDVAEGYLEVRDQAGAHQSFCSWFRNNGLCTSGRGAWDIVTLAEKKVLTQNSMRV